MQVHQEKFNCKLREEKSGSLSPRFLQSRLDRKQFEKLNTKCPKLSREERRDLFIHCQISEVGGSRKAYQKRARKLLKLRKEVNVIEEKLNRVETNNNIDLKHNIDTKHKPFEIDTKRKEFQLCSKHKSFELDSKHKEFQSDSKHKPSEVTNGQDLERQKKIFFTFHQSLGVEGEAKHIRSEQIVERMWNNMHCSKSHNTLCNR